MRESTDWLVGSRSHGHMATYSRKRGSMAFESGQDKRKIELGLEPYSNLILSSLLLLSSISLHRPVQAGDASYRVWRKILKGVWLVPIVRVQGCDA